MEGIMYEEFAYVYDRMMEHIPYDAWFASLLAYLKDHGVSGGTMCELGCGTGAMTVRFARAGFDMIGVDRSADMLSVAQSKSGSTGQDILYIQQDMRELELAGPVDVMISVCDSMNYLLEEEEVRDVLGGVRKFLRPGGYFIFDLKTVYCYRNVIGSQIWAEPGDEISYIWDNYFYEDEDINEYRMTVFCRQPDSGLYKRFDEIHYQRAYSVGTVKELLEGSGFRLAECLDASMERQAGDDSERIYFVAEKVEGKDE